MKRYDKIAAGIIVVIILLVIGVNVCLCALKSGNGGKPWLVEVNRISFLLETHEPDEIDLSEYHYVTGLERYGIQNFYDVDCNYCIREINGILYRFDYDPQIAPDWKTILCVVNLGLGIMVLILVLTLLLIRCQVLAPFEKLSDVPYELAKGNLTVPLKENKGRFFGRFVWGVDLLREKMEEQKQRELQLQRDKKTLLLSLSHDIKTPLSAIKLHAKALEKGLYTEEEIHLEVAEAINRKADEIENFLSEIDQASREDILSLEVKIEECYLSEVIDRICRYYEEKLALFQTEFAVGTYLDCLIRADRDRSVEILQNIMENAIKYGDGRRIQISISEEENHILVEVENSGSFLSESELPHIFESFWRGGNVKNQAGSGLGLYICRQLIHKMDGEIFAECRGDLMSVTVVFVKA